MGREGQTCMHACPVPWGELPTGKWLAHALQQEGSWPVVLSQGTLAVEMSEWNSHPDLRLAKVPDGWLPTIARTDAA